jgi:hypothetical protein
MTVKKKKNVGGDQEFADHVHPPALQLVISEHRSQPEVSLRIKTGSKKIQKKKK